MELKNLDNIAISLDDVIKNKKSEQREQKRQQLDYHYDILRAKRNAQNERHFEIVRQREKAMNRNRERSRSMDRLGHNDDRRKPAKIIEDKTSLI